jgi:hypothetical protein
MQLGERCGTVKSRPLHAPLIDSFVSLKFIYNYEIICRATSEIFYRVRLTTLRAFSMFWKRTLRREVVGSTRIVPKKDFTRKTR